MIHREGQVFLILLFLSLVALNFVLAYYLKSPVIRAVVIGSSLLLFVFFLQFFRNPTRNIQQDDDLILSPADGKVVIIKRTYEKEFLKKECLQVSIFMSPFNVHVNRVPASGNAKYYQYHEGKYLVAWHPKSSELNERTTLVIENPKGTLLVRQIAGAVARRIVCYAKTGDVLNQGDEYGFIKFGSRADLYLPLDTKILVKEGDICVGGITKIAKW